LRRDPVNAHAVCRPAADPSPREVTADQRNLAEQLTRQTDSILAALARTIELERQRIGMPGVGHPKDGDHQDRCGDAMALSFPPDHPQPIFGRIRPLLEKGCGVQRIARELHLPEAEVDMAINLHGFQTRSQEGDA
jgi:hypothetical protein